jgi:EmrB/QacA subfamily drug resistance transporter
MVAVLQRPQGEVLRSRWVALALLAGAQLMLVLDVTVVNVALPDIGAGLHLTRAVLPWAMTMYTLFFGGLMLLGGRVADVVGARRATLVGLAVFTVASLVCGSASNGATLLGGRALQGAAAALMSPAALATVLGLYRDGARAKAVGVWSAISGVGMALGVILGGVLTSSVGWRWVFTINVPIGVALLFTIPLFTRPQASSAPAGRRLDLPGAALVTGGTGAAIYGLVHAGTAGWADPATLAALLGAAVLWGLLAVAESRARDPLLTVALLSRRPALAGSYLMLVATGLMVGGFFLGSFDLQRMHSYSAVHVGLSFLPTAATTVLGAHAAGHILRHFNARLVAVVALALTATGFATAARGHAAAATAFGLAVAALGMGAVFVTAFTAALADAPANEAGLRSALVNTFHELGGAAGVATLSTAAGVALAGNPDSGGFTTGFTTGAVIAAVAAVLAVIVVPTVLRDPSSGPAH